MVRLAGHFGRLHWDKWKSHVTPGSLAMSAGAPPETPGALAARAPPPPPPPAGETHKKTHKRAPPETPGALAARPARPPRTRVRINQRQPAMVIAPRIRNRTMIVPLYFPF